MDLYMPKQKKISRSPKSNFLCFRKSRNWDIKRVCMWHIAVFLSTPRDPATESLTTDTTPTPAPSKLHQILIEPVLTAKNTNFKITTNQVAIMNWVADAEWKPEIQALILHVNYPLIPSLTFAIPAAEQIASLLYTTYIVYKLIEHRSFFLFCEQLYHKYYHANLISFF